MGEKMRRRVAALVLVMGVVLALVSAGPLSWGLGALVALGMIVGGWHVLTDPRPRELRRPMLERDR